MFWNILLFHDTLGKQPQTWKFFPLAAHFIKRREKLMEPSKVYFTNLRVHNGDNLQKKLERLIRRAGIETIDFDGKYAAVKIHFGEPGNLA